MPIEDRDFYTLQANVAHQNENLREIKEEVREMKEELKILIEHMHQDRGSRRTLAFFAGLIGAFVAGATEYIIYYVLQK